MSFRPKKKKVRGQPRESNGSVLDLPLFHGDMVVMHGTEIHRCYEVSLTGVGPLSRRGLWTPTNNSIELSRTESAVLPSPVGI